MPVSIDVPLLASSTARVSLLNEGLAVIGNSSPTCHDNSGEQTATHEHTARDGQVVVQQRLTSIRQADADKLCS